MESEVQNLITPQDSNQFMKSSIILKADSGVASLVMDELNNEGIAGSNDYLVFTTNYCGKVENFTKQQNAITSIEYNKKHKQCEARFAPGKNASVDIYYAFVSSLQYIYVRNYAQNTIVKRVSESIIQTITQQKYYFDTYINTSDQKPNLKSSYMTLTVDYNSLMISEDDESENLNTAARTVSGGEQVLTCVGTREGKLLIFKVTSTGSQKLAETKGGVSYGAITAVDVTGAGQENSLDPKIVAATQSGELFTVDILTNIHFKFPIQQFFSFSFKI